ncbi:MAG: 2-amino-4-hydroxy-6-hydroxymethyldihydropteridine diphosphokinase [Bryobacterales bacterium]|nr:2-amino-4-hydroxy-6-hydroxymethyldihydropteridine diphosphokinase [Bryobacterales bacterium]
MKTVYIALGSNLGDRVANLLQARERMQSSNLRLTRASSVYETEPRGLLDQPWFLNQVIEAETTLFPRQLLARLLKIEQEMGRQRLLPNGPRVIDLDILLFGNMVMHLPGLEVPHPRMAERRFVLEPLAELAPAIRHPRTGRSVREMLTEVTDQPVRRLTS